MFCFSRRKAGLESRPPPRLAPHGDIKHLRPWRRPLAAGDPGTKTGAVGVGGGGSDGGSANEAITGGSFGGLPARAAAVATDAAAAASFRNGGDGVRTVSVAARDGTRRRRWGWRRAGCATRAPSPVALPPMSQPGRGPGGGAECSGGCAVCTRASPACTNHLP
ncbi:hypothetical protein PLESTF_001196500 [Pleodorina starrii]|nr:hypothetical protein PLESTF_001196500 [Pleodorina starrii]